MKLKNIVVLIVLVAIGYPLSVFWFRWGPSVVSKPIFYELKPSERLRSLSEALEERGVVSSAPLFYWYARILGNSNQFKAADYKFHTKMTPSEVCTVLRSGVSYGIPFTIPEGYNLEQISEGLERLKEGAGKEFLKLSFSKAFLKELEIPKEAVSLEGYLFPDTYMVSKSASIPDLIRNMHRKYRLIFNDEARVRAQEIKLSEHQVVTLASIVEKETGATEERPLIASVFHNRLKKKMRLQSDPTVVYGVKGYDGNITRKDLDRSTPYNTYKIPGLPIGPISNPSKEAIIAVLFPKESTYLYFVSHNDGTHEFTSTYEEHQKAVERFQLDRKAREGKSWRDLKNRKKED